MASVPGGPPMASGAAESGLTCAERQYSNQGQRSRSNGARVQLFQDQHLSSGPDGAANGSDQTSHSQPKAPPPDLVQSQSDTRAGQGNVDPRNMKHRTGYTDARQRELLSDDLGGLHAGVATNQRNPEGNYYQPDPLGIGPEGYNVLDLTMQRQGHVQGQRSFPSDMDSSLRYSAPGINSPNQAVFRDNIGSADILRAQRAGGHLGTGFLPRNIQIPSPDQNDSFDNTVDASLRQRENSLQNQATNYNNQHRTQKASSRTDLSNHERDVNESLQRQNSDNGNNREAFDKDQVMPESLGIAESDSVESGMYGEPEDDDLSAEFLPLDAEAQPVVRERLNTATDEEDCEDEYEDNTEVDQDVVLQPEADQTSYSDDNGNRSNQVEGGDNHDDDDDDDDGSYGDQVEGQDDDDRHDQLMYGDSRKVYNNQLNHNLGSDGWRLVADNRANQSQGDPSANVRVSEARASAFQPIAVVYGNQSGSGRGNGSAPVYVTPVTVPLSINANAMAASGGLHGNSGMSHQRNQSSNISSKHAHSKSVSQGRQAAPRESMNRSDNMNPEDDQVVHDTESTQAEPPKNQGPAANALGSGSRGNASLMYDNTEQAKHTDSQPLNSLDNSQASGTSQPSNLAKQGARPKQLDERPKSSSTEPGTNAGKQHVGAKTQKSHPQPVPAAKRTKIRTLPPNKVDGAAASSKQKANRNKTNTKAMVNERPVVGQQNSSVRPRTSTNAKSPNRPPTQRQAPSGGDSSTASMGQGQTSQSQGQGHSNQSQGYSDQAQGYSNQGQIYPSQSQGYSSQSQGYSSQGQIYSSQSQGYSSLGIFQQPIHVGQYTLAGSQGNYGHTSRYHATYDRDGAEGFMRPNPIGETDAGVRGAQGGVNVGDGYVMMSNRNPPPLSVSYQPGVGTLGGQGHTNDPMSMAGDGDEATNITSQSGSSSHQPSVQYGPQNATGNYVAVRGPDQSFRGGEQLLQRQVLGLSQAPSHPPLQPLHVHTSTNSQPVAQQINSPVNQPVPHHQNHLGTSMHHVPPYSAAYSLTMGGGNPADSTHANVHSRERTDSYVAWDHSLELSPISRTSGATDRVQMMLASPCASSSCRDGRDNPHNMSFQSAASDKQGDQTLTDIGQMEHLRGQIRNMLRMTGQAIPDSDTYDQVSYKPETPLPMMQQEANTSVLMSSKVLSEFATDVSINQSSRYYSMPAGGSTGQPVDLTSIRADNQALREILEKERFRRKHCERQIQELQNRIMETQQQLAVAVSTDRKKDLMIEQLDKTLVQVVENWKKKEVDRQQMISMLQRENDEMRTKQRQQQQLQERFETELTETVDQLAQEQQRAKLTEEEQLTQLEAQREEIERLSRLLEEEQQRSESLEVKLQQTQGECEEAKDKYMDIHNAFEEDKESWDEKEREYLQKIEQITDNHLSKMEEARIQYQDQGEELAETQNLLTAAQTDRQRFQLEHDSANREKESLKVQMGLMEAKFESQLRKQEAELQADFEKQLAERVEEEQQTAAERDEEARERHHKQVMELTQRHSQEIEMAQKRHQGEMWRSEDTWKREVRDRDDKIELFQQEIADLKVANKRLEQQRSEMTVKLQTMMQHHCNEALRLLQIGSHALANSPNKQMFQMATTTPDLNTTLFSMRSSTANQPVSIAPSMATVSRHQPPVSLPYYPVSVTTQPVTMTTSVVASGLRSSVLESVPQSEAGTSNIERYLQSLHQSSQQNGSEQPTSHKQTGSDSGRHGDDEDFQLLTESLNNSMTSDITQIPFSDRLTNPDASFISQMAPPSSMPTLSDFHQTLLQNFVQSLPTSQTLFSQSQMPFQNYSQLQPSLQNMAQPTHQNAQYSSSQQHSLASSQSAAVSMAPSSYYSHGNQSSMQTKTTGSQPPVSAWPQQTASTQSSLFNSNGPTIMLHPPVQRDHVTIPSQSTQSLASQSGDDPHLTSREIANRFEPLQHEESMNTSASSDWGYPSKEAGKESLFTHILNQHLSQSPSVYRGLQEPNHQHEPVRLNETPELDDVSNRFDQHESRQNELQHYIKMLLKQPPDTAHVSPADTAHVSPAGSSRQTAPCTDEVTPPRKPGQKSVAFSKTTVVVPPPGASAPGGPHSIAMETMTLPGLDNLGSFSPQQMGEISRLLGRYGRHQGPGTSIPGQQNNPSMEQIVGYLRDLQTRNDDLASSPVEPQIPVQDRHQSPPSPARSRSTGSRSPGRTNSTNRVKKNLEERYAGPQSSRPAISIPGEQSSSHQGAPLSSSHQGAPASCHPRQTNVSTQKTSKPAPGKKKSDRKTAHGGKGANSIWK